jgi:2-C-methyl-D-erythritol 4-phosphate cytidylyltransferase
VAYRSQFWALIPAAGMGLRVGADIPKQYLQLAGRCVIEHGLSLFINHTRIAGVVVVLAPDDRHWSGLTLSRSPRVHTVMGGAERPESVLAGLERLKSLASDDDWVLVHDAARPCLSRAMLDGLISELERDPVGGLLALPACDTIKQADGERVTATLDRRMLWQAQTPQMFRLGSLHAALTEALRAGLMATDESYAMEQAGHAPRLIEGSVDNLKITRPEDIALAEFILRRRQEGVH